MSGPIATTYVEVRPTRDAKGDFKRDVEQVIDPAARSATQRISKAVSDGLKTPAGAAGVGAAVGTLLGQGVASGIRRALSAATSTLRIGLDEVKDYQAGLAQLEAGIKSTGGTAGLTAPEMEKLASAVQKYSGQTDDSIVRAEGFLLTFDKVRDRVGQGNDVFTRATRASADLAARGFGSAESGALQLGKALQDPVQGLTALRRSGISFTQQQQDQIKAMVKVGDVAGYQKIILAEVEKQVGGSAKAYGETLPGQIDRSRRAFEDLSQEVLGKSAPAIEAAATGARALFDVLGRAGPVVPIVAGVAGGLVVATKAVKIYKEVKDTLFAGTAKQVAANEAVARSYDDVTAAATRAAGAETLASGGAGAGAAAAGTGAAGAGSAAAGAGRFARFAKGVGIAALIYELLDAAHDGLFERDPDGKPRGQMSIEQWQEEHGYRPKRPRVDDTPINTSRPLDPRLEAAGKALAAARGELNDPARRAAEASSLAGVFGSAFSQTAVRTQGTPEQIADAREAQRKADRAVADAQRALAKAQEGGAGAKRSQIESAEASVASAQAALRKRGGDDKTEQARLEAAEARLSELRRKGGVNTDKLREAEDRLKEARRNAGQAADDTKKVEATTALSVQDITKRLGGQLKNAKGLRDDARTLIKDGVSRGVLEELDKLEQTAPGTLDRVAKSMTPALAKQLNSQYADLQKVQQEFLVAPLRAAAEAAKAEQDKILAEAAASQAAAYQRALKQNLFAGLGAPTPETPTAQPTSLDQFGRTQAGVPVAVTVQLTGVKAQTVTDIVTSEIRQADRVQGQLVGVN